MITLGFLTIHKNQENTYATNIGRFASKHDVTYYRFTPFCIHPQTELVNGEKYVVDTDEWISCEFPLPSFIYDRCFYKNDSLSKRARPIVEWLKKRHDLTFLGYGLPDKWTVHQSLQEDGDISPYLPETTLVHSAKDVMELLMKKRRILIKPCNGSQGNGIIALTIERSGLCAHYHKGYEAVKKQFDRPEHLRTWLTRVVLHQPYLVQPYFHIHNQKGRPFDIRVLLQKNENGEWGQVGKGIRMGGDRSLVTNVSAGGEIVTFSEWSAKLPPRKRLFIEEELESICRLLPASLEKKVPSLFELGVDICTSHDGGVWLLDINSKPGRKTILHTQPESEDRLYEAPILYCKHLANSKTTVNKE